MRSTRAKKSATGANRIRRSPKLPRSVTSASSSGGSLQRLHRVARKVESFSDPDLAPGPYQAFPLIRIVRHLAGQQNFDAPTQKISCRRIVRAQRLGPLSASVAVEPGREHPRIVHHQQVVWAQQAGEFAKTPILPTLPLPTPRQPIQAQQTRCGAIRQRFLRNAFGRQIVLEVRDEHRGDYRV